MGSRGAGGEARGQWDHPALWKVQCPCGGVGEGREQGPRWAGPLPPTCHLTSQGLSPKALVTGLSGHSLACEANSAYSQSLVPARPSQHSFPLQRTRPVLIPRPPWCTTVHTPTQAHTCTHSHAHAHTYTLTQSALQPPARPQANDQPAERVLTLNRPHPLRPHWPLGPPCPKAPGWGRVWRRAG